MGVAVSISTRRKSRKRKTLGGNDSVGAEPRGEKKVGGPKGIGGSRSTTPIIFAATEGYVNIVKLLLNVGGVHIKRAFKRACTNGHVDVVRLLLQYKSDIVRVGTAVDGPLRLAAGNGHRMVVDMLLDRTAITAYPLESIVKLLDAVATGGRENIVELLLTRDPEILHRPGVFATALSAASAQGHLSLVRMLVDKYPDVNDFEYSLRRALIRTCSKNRIDVTRFLLEKGADFTNQNINLLVMAAANGFEEIAQLLLKHGLDVNSRNHGRGRRDNALEAAIIRPRERGDCPGATMVQILFDYNIDLNINDYSAREIKLEVTRAGCEDVMRLLLNYNPRFNIQCAPAFQEASRVGQAHIAQLLLNHDVDYTADELASALVEAASNGHDNIVTMLLEHGVDVDRRVGEQDNALRAACYELHVSTVVTLIHHGADVNAYGGWHKTALHAAISRSTANDSPTWGLRSNGRVRCDGDTPGEKIMKILLDHGADINAQGDFERTGSVETVLQSALEGGNGRVTNRVNLLLRYGADINAQRGYYGTALQKAAVVADASTVELLLKHNADVNFQGGHYGNALKAARAKNRPTVERLLTGYGAMNQ